MKINPNKNKSVETPDVICLPPDLVAEAKAAMENGDIEDGPVTEVPDLSDSAALYAAAKGVLEQELSPVEVVPVEEPVVDPAPPVGEPIDAEYKEIPDEELVLAELIRDKDKEPEPVEVKISEFSLHVIRDGAKNLWLRIVAFGNEIADHYMKVTAKLHTKIGEATKHINEWALARNAEFQQWRKNHTEEKMTSEEFRDCMDVVFTQLNHMTELVIQQAETIRSLEETITNLQVSVRKNTKAVDRVVRNATLVDPDTLTKFGSTMMQGRKTNAAHLYRDLTGASLADAKEAVEKMTPVKEPA